MLGRFPPRSCLHGIFPSSFFSSGLCLPSLSPSFFFSNIYPQFFSELNSNFPIKCCLSSLYLPIFCTLFFDHWVFILSVFSTQVFFIPKSFLLTFSPSAHSAPFSPEASSTRFFYHDTFPMTYSLNVFPSSATTCGSFSSIFH